jgi:hypothetical protein
MRNLALSVVLVAGLFLSIGAIHAQSTATVTSSRKDGTAFTGMRRGHTARYQGQDATIYYPFHPRCGSRVAIVPRHPFRGVTMLVVEHAACLSHCGTPSWLRQPELVDRDVNSMVDIAVCSTTGRPLYGPV